MYSNDKRIVLTLDAGGTNFVFSAVRAYKSIVEPVRKKAVPDDALECLKCITEGFREVVSRLDGQEVSAISFAFPGPADYASGVLGDLPNFPGFRGGVAMGAYLEDEFGIPVFINNDGNLFAYGEALAGVLPMVNAMLDEAGSPKRYRNLIGVTLGTGFGCGVVVDGKLLSGDNGCGGDLWCTRNSLHEGMIAEESVSIRAVKRVYEELSGQDASELNPKDIFYIAEGLEEGNREAAIKSFEKLGTAAADSVSAALNLIDGIVCIGGGVAGAAKYIMPAMVKRLNSSLSTFSGALFPCIQMSVWNLEDESHRKLFLKDESSLVNVHGKNMKILYQPVKKTALALSRLGASTSIFYGAYAYALSQLDL